MTTINKISSNISMNRLKPILTKKDLGKPSIQSKLRVEYKDLNKFKQNTPFNDLLKSLYLNTLENKTDKQKSEIFYGSVAYDYNLKAVEHNKQIELNRKNKRAEAAKAKKSPKSQKSSVSPKSQKSSVFPKS